MTRQIHEGRHLLTECTYRPFFRFAERVHIDSWKDCGVLRMHPIDRDLIFLKEYSSLA